MIDREKVIKGLICHVHGNPHTRCNDCPYWGTGPHGFSQCSLLFADALALLKAQDEELERLKLCRHNCKIDCLLESYNRVVNERDALRKAQEPAKVLTPNKIQGGWKEGYCPYCGMKVESFYNTHFCGTCGKAVKWE